MYLHYLYISENVTSRNETKVLGVGSTWIEISNLQFDTVYIRNGYRIYYHNLLIGTVLSIDDNIGIPNNDGYRF